ncbi:hypothetical protein FOA52_004739, partial [Chlamydomonas sp. UWO 241]
MSIQETVPELADLVASASADGDDDGDGGGAPAGEAGGSGRGASASGGGSGGRAAKRKKVFDEHRSAADIQAGIKDGRYHQGALRVSRYNPFEGCVGSDSVGSDILVSGRIDMNRALDGDVVAVELLPQDQWRAEAKTLPGGPGRSNDAAGGGGGGDDGGDDGDADGVGAARVAPEEHYDDSVGASSGSGARPTGRVVGVIRRNWRTRGYCGSLKPTDQPGHVGNTSAVLFVPIERRYPMVRITTRQADVLMDKRLLVAIDGWDADSMYPHGHYVRTLGTIGDKATET